MQTANQDLGKKHYNGALLATIVLAGLMLPTNSLTAQASNSSRPMPGYWEFNTKAAGIFNDSDKHCLSQAEVDKFYSNPCKRNSVCTYQTKAFNPDGTVILNGTWTDRHNKVTKIKTNGTFKPDYLKVKGNVVLSWGLPVAITFEANRLSGVCPKE